MYRCVYPLNAENVLKNSSKRCHFVKFDIHFLGFPKEIFFRVITDD